MHIADVLIQSALQIHQKAVFWKFFVLCVHWFIILNLTSFSKPFGTLLVIFSRYGKAKAGAAGYQLAKAKFVNLLKSCNYGSWICNKAQMVDDFGLPWIWNIYLHCWKYLTCIFNSKNLILRRFLFSMVILYSNLH